MGRGGGGGGRGGGGGGGGGGGETARVNQAQQQTVAQRIAIRAEFGNVIDGINRLDERTMDARRNFERGIGNTNLSPARLAQREQTWRRNREQLQTAYNRASAFASANGLNAPPLPLGLMQ